jgi:hypothetical protein
MVEAVVIGEEEDGLLQSLELISTPSRELLPLMSVSDTKRRDFASSATRRGTVSSNARSFKTRSRSTHPTGKNDVVKAALRTSWSN